LSIKAAGDKFKVLASLEDDLKFIFITSLASVSEVATEAEEAVAVAASKARSASAAGTTAPTSAPTRTTRPCAAAATATCLVRAKNASSLKICRRSRAGGSPCRAVRAWIPAARTTANHGHQKNLPDQILGQPDAWLGIARHPDRPADQDHHHQDLPAGEEKFITSFFNLVLAYNKGAAFSFLRTAAAGSATSSPPSASAPPSSSSTC
jgi:hypothetical protein